MHARLADPQRSRAILVGVGAYDELHPLPAVDGNLTDLRAVLTSAGGARLPDAHCRVLRDPREEATVGEALASAAAEAEDMLLVYYAGHGLIAGPGNELFLATAGTRERTVATSALPCAEVRRAIEGSPARARVLVVDCCFSGRAITHTMASPQEVVLAGVEVRGAFILTSAAPTQTALAPEGARHTLFTGALLAALRDGVPGAGPLLTLGALSTHLGAAMARRGGPTPRFRVDGTVAHLALATNQAPLSAAARVERDRAERALGALARAEAELRDMLAAVGGRIAVPDQRLRWALAPLRERFDAVDAEAGGGGWTAARAGFAAVAAEAERATREVAARRADLAALPQLHVELRGRLKGYLAMAVRLGVAEDGALAADYAAARDLLRRRPCDLAAADAAVKRYQDGVTRFREGA